MQIKKCVKCSEDKEFLSFYKDKRASDGLFSSCKDCTLARQKGYKPKTKRKRIPDPIYYAKYREVNRETVNANSKRYRVRNKEYYAYKAAERRASKLNATPCWLSTHHQQEIKDMYWLARDLSRVSEDIYEVDHIVPLKGKYVCGLHVPWNLQVLPQDLNRRKSNK